MKKNSFSNKCSGMNKCNILSKTEDWQTEWPDEEIEEKGNKKTLTYKHVLTTYSRQLKRPKTGI